MRAALLAVLALAALSSSASGLRLGTAKCTWGPSFWCSDLFSSKACGATSHCAKRVWPRMEVPQDNDEVCDICKEMVKEARDTLNSNQTLEELKEVFDRTCGFIPVRMIADECKVLSEQFIVELVETLSSEMNPDVVCSTAGLCNSARIDKLLSRYYATHPTISECDWCKHVSKQVWGKIESMAKRDVEDKVLEMCGRLGSYSDSCRQVVVENFNAIYTVLESLKNGQVCDAVGLCSESFQHVVRSVAGLRLRESTPRGKEDLECEFCTKVVQHWKDSTTSETSEAEFKKVGEALCERFEPVDKRAACKERVDEYAAMVFRFIRDDLDPRLACELAGLCGNNGGSAGGKIFRVNDDTSIDILFKPRTTDGDVEESEEDMSVAALEGKPLVGGYFVPQTELVASKPNCVICEYAVTTLADWVGQEIHDEEVVREKLDKLCQKMPNAVAVQCDNLVNHYGRAIVALLTHDIPPASVCAHLKLCSASPGGALLVDQQGALPTALQTTRKRSESCALCEYAMQMVFDMLNDPSDERAVKNALDTVCYHLPSSISNECEKMVASHTAELLHLITELLSPDAVCAGIQMCKPEDDRPAPAKPTKDDQKCLICEYIIEVVDQAVADKHNEEEVKRALEGACEKLPGKIGDRCSKFVEKYMDLIVDFIVHDVTPEQICTEIGFCQKFYDIFKPRLLATNSLAHGAITDDTPAPAVVVQEEEEDSSVGDDERPYCRLCEYAIGEVDKVISDKKNEEEIREQLDKICFKLALPVAKECKRMVDQYMEELIQFFVNDYTPEEICVELKMCKPEVHDALLGHTNELPVYEDDEDEDETSTEVGAAAGPTSAKKPYCVLCELAMKRLDRYILSDGNRTIDFVERGVEFLCAHLPESVARPCEDFVNEYGDEVARLFVEVAMDPEEVCTEIELCPAKSVQEGLRLVGNNECVWGPSYWCKSRVHARLCGTTEHCERHGWDDQ